jgi:hypothetical protein
MFTGYRYNLLSYDIVYAVVKSTEAFERLRFTGVVRSNLI